MNFSFAFVITVVVLSIIVRFFQKNTNEPFRGLHPYSPYHDYYAYRPYYTRYIWNNPSRDYGYNSYYLWPYYFW